MAVKRWNGSSWVTYAGGDSSVALPSQSGNSGKYLTTDGTVPSWATITLPSAATKSTLGTVYGLTQVFSGNEGFDAPYDNTALGFRALNSGTNAKRNIAIGTDSSYSILNGYSNVSIGYKSLYSLVNSVWNVVIGQEAAYSLNAAGNTVIGHRAMYSNTSGQNNVVIGQQAAGSLTGSQNIIIGSSSSPNLAGGSNNIVLGANVDPSTSTTSNEITIGNSSNNRFRIPGLAVDWSTSAYGRATYASTSAPSGGNDGDVWLVYA